jgi:hypothetical protein
MLWRAAWITRFLESVSLEPPRARRVIRLFVRWLSVTATKARVCSESAGCHAYLRYRRNAGPRDIRMNTLATREGVELFEGGDPVYARSSARGTPWSTRKRARSLSSIAPQSCRPSWTASRRCWHNAGDSGDAFSPSVDGSLDHLLEARRSDARGLIVTRGGKWRSCV